MDYNYEPRIPSMTEFLDLIYISTISAIDIDGLKERFKLHHYNLGDILHYYNYKTFDHFLAFEVQDFIKVYVGKYCNSEIIKLYFNEKGFEKAKSNDLIGYIDSCCYKPEEPYFIEILPKNAFLLDERYEFDICNGRNGLLRVLGCFRKGKKVSYQELERKMALSTKNGITTLFDFRKKYFPHVSKWLTVIQKYCWEEIKLHRENGRDYLECLVDYEEFKIYMSECLELHNEILNYVDKHCQVFEDKSLLKKIKCGNIVYNEEENVPGKPKAIKRLRKDSISSNEDISRPSTGVFLNENRKNDVHSSKLSLSEDDDIQSTEYGNKSFIISEDEESNDNNENQSTKLSLPKLPTLIGRKKLNNNETNRLNGGTVERFSRVSIDFTG